MALESEINIEGLTKTDGYWRVTAINWDASRAGDIRVALSAYASKQSYEEGKREIETEIILVPINNPSMLSLFNTCRGSAYANAKQIERFSKAKDV
jgi:hypothetical protein